MGTRQGKREVPNCTSDAGSPQPVPRARWHGMQGESYSQLIPISLDEIILLGRRVKTRRDMTLASVRIEKWKVKK